MWKATKDGGFNNLGDWKKSKASKAWEVGRPIGLELDVWLALGLFDEPNA